MHRRQVHELARTFAQSPPELLGRRLEESLARDPRCPLTRYLLACQCFDRGRTAPAVRHMMVAHHREPDLESAALLVFAGLNAIRQRGRPLLPVLLETWEEFRRPRFDRYACERALLDAFAEPAPRLDAAAPLARRLWRLPLRTLRQQIAIAVSDRDTALFPLLITPV